ncbi:hypothetical protein NDA01_03560 [Trichocoleus desertorum AS-A10]|uniref:hypothetical protein n=1 Tax=Trichocoleus desertorum TaxID=1481672 RepID=UPI0032976B8F
MPKRSPRTARRQPPREQEPRQQKPGGYQMPDVLEEPLQPWLEPIGDTGFYQSPLEPVDPRDCDRWPDSPSCGGSGVNIDDFINVVPQVHANDCEICVTFSPTLAFISLPPYTICYRKDSPECRPEPPPPPPAPPPRQREYESPDGVRASRWTFPVEKQCIGQLYLVEFSYEVYYPARTFVSQGATFNFPEETYSGLYSVLAFAPIVEVGFAQNPALDPGNGELTLKAARTYGLGRPIEQVFSTNPLRANYIEWQTNTGFRVGPPAVHSLFNVKLFRVSDEEELVLGLKDTYPWLYSEFCTRIPAVNLPDPPPPPPPGPILPPPLNNPPREPCCMNCAEQDRLLRLIAKRLGTDDYPASVPKSLLTDRGSEQQQIESLTQFLGWFVQQVDSLAGEFPIEINVEDIDPTKPGKQSKKVKVPNLAEAIAELYGLALKNTVDSDIHTNFMMRLAAEIIATKNAAIVTQDYARANATFLGYKANPKRRKVNYAFNPEGLESLETVLQESEKYVQGWQEDDPETVVGFLQRIVFSAGIIKAAFLRNKDQLGNLKGDLDNLLKSDEGDQDDLWKQFLRSVENPNHRINTGNVPTPEIKDLSMTSNEGLGNLLDEQT